VLVVVPAAFLALRALSPGDRDHGTLSTGQAPGVFLPVEQERPNGSMAALLTSKFEVQNGCLFAGPHRATLLLWPFGAHLAERIAGEPLRVLDESGRTIAIEGQPLHLGGGYVSEAPDRTAAPERIVGAPIPARCRPSYGYWLVGDANEVRPQPTPSIGGTPTPHSEPGKPVSSVGRSNVSARLGHSIRLFHGRTNNHFWNLDAAHEGRTWELVLKSTSGEILFQGRQTLGATHPALYGHYTWNDPGGPASIVFGLGRPPQADVLGVRITDPFGRARLSEDVHPPDLPSTLRFFLQDFGGKIAAIHPARRP
jgi:hypothetical protein